MSDNKKSGNDHPTKQSGHKHAALMAEYAKDAAETDKPWERWEYRIDREYEWKTSFTHPAWAKDTEYRRKPKPLEVWVNIYPDGEKYMHDTPEAAAAGTQGYRKWCRTVHMREVADDE